jgi:hypothetical protein
MGDGSLLVAYAAAGDTNLDSLVDLLDVANVLASGLFDSGVHGVWSQGDFNYDSLVDILDAADLLSAGLFDQGSYTNGTAGGTAAGAVAVPEPAFAPVLTVVAGILAAAVRRR